MPNALHEIGGYVAVLPHVQNCYAVDDNEAGGFCWGFKYTSGVFEYFQHAEEEAAEAERAAFMAALNAWHSITRLNVGHSITRLEIV